MPSYPEIVKVAVPQAEPEWLDLKAGIAKSIKLIQEASQNGAQLIAFSECWIPGYPSFLWSYNFKDTVSMLFIPIKVDFRLTERLGRFGETVSRKLDRD